MELDLTTIKEKYFSSKERKIFLKKGDALLNEGSRNQRLFLVHKGLLRGFAKNPDGTSFKLFNAAPDSFVGLVSFFSGGFTITATVIAEEPTELLYVDWSLVEDSVEERSEFMALFTPVVVSELLERQRENKKMSLEKEQTLKKLIESEKMAYLGQMAAGIAHELNNSIAVVGSNATWLGEKMEKQTQEIFPVHHSVFSEGLEKGNRLSSSQIREKAGEITKRFAIEGRQAKRLAQTGISFDSIAGFSGKPETGQQVCDLWEMGSVIHDIKMAAKQSSHVVKSVKALGRPEPSSHEPVDVNETIISALTLLRYELKGIRNEFSECKGAIIEASTGYLVQIWVNLIKNAAESLTHAKTEDPFIGIESRMIDGSIFVMTEDNGPGIPENIREKIFQPNVTTKVEGLSFGLGLGLNIVERLINLYNGEIAVSSRPGKTVFTVKFPLTKEG